VTKESVDHPAHYNTGRFETIDVIEDWGLGFNLGNAVKYISRAAHKGKRLEDLKKAAWYLQREIEGLSRPRDPVVDPPRREIARCSKCKKEVIPKGDWSNETSLCQVCETDLKKKS